MNSQRSIAFLLFAAVVVMLGAFVIYDISTNERLKGVTGNKESNWEWNDEWRRNAHPVPKEQEEEESPKQQIIAANYQDALQQSGQTGMPVLVYFEASWCKWCEKMKRETLNNSGVKELMKNYILVFVDIDQNRGLGRKFGLKSLPTYLITNYKEENLKMGDGYVAANTFEIWLNQPDLFQQPKSPQDKESPEVQPPVERRPNPKSEPRNERIIPRSPG